MVKMGLLFTSPKTTNVPPPPTYRSGSVNSVLNQGLRINGATTPSSFINSVNVSMIDRIATARPSCGACGK